MWCFEKCVKFISKNGYIIIAIKGGSFCSSTREAASLIFHNMGKIGVVQIVTHFVLRLGKVCVVIVSMMLMLKLIRDPPSMWIPLIGQVDDATRGLATVSNPILPMLATLILSLSMSSYCFTVYQLTIDTILLCFCEDLKVNKDGQGYFMSAELLYYVNKTAWRTAGDEELKELEPARLEHQESIRRLHAADIDGDGTVDSSERKRAQKLAAKKQKDAKQYTKKMLRHDLEPTTTHMQSI